MKTPNELKYSEEHEWVKVEGDIVTVGITDFAQQQLTDVVYVELPEIGKKVEQNGNLCVVESVKSVSDIFCPVLGEVVEVNSELTDKPELVNEDPYGKGWIAKFKVTDMAGLNNLMNADEYAAMIDGE